MTLLLLTAVTNSQLTTVSPKERLFSLFQLAANMLFQYDGLSHDMNIHDNSRHSSRAAENQITKIICANGGSMELDELVVNMSLEENITELLSNKDRFPRVLLNGHTVLVVSKSPLRVCRTRGCSGWGGCSDLHLCKKFLLGSHCPSAQQRYSTVSKLLRSFGVYISLI